MPDIKKPFLTPLIDFLVDHWVGFENAYTDINLGPDEPEAVY